MSVVYLNFSGNTISQTWYMDGAWSNSDLIQAAEPPASDTRLSMSTNIVPTLTIGNTTVTSPSYLPSVVTYQQANGSLIMINIDPTTQEALDSGDNVNPNIFHLLKSSFRSEVVTISEATPASDFSCIYNSPHPPVYSGLGGGPSQLYAQCYIAPSDPEYYSSTDVTGWWYNQTGSGNGNFTVDRTLQGSYGKNLFFVVRTVITAGLV